MLLEHHIGIRVDVVYAAIFVIGQPDEIPAAEAAVRAQLPQDFVEIYLHAQQELAAGIARPDRAAACLLILEERLDIFRLERRVEYQVEV